MVSIFWLLDCWFVVGYFPQGDRLNIALRFEVSIGDRAPSRRSLFLNTSYQIFLDSSVSVALKVV